MDIIADIGSNFRTYQDCFQSIDAAKHAGATHVKFQYYTHKCLYGYDDPNDTRVYFDQEWIKWLAQEAGICGIGFLCTVFNPKFVKHIDDFVEIHKVASSDIGYIQLLEEIAKTKKKTYVSVGAASSFEIEQAIDIIGRDNITLLYCVSAYPSTEVDITKIGQLRKKYNVPVGFSDHTTDVFNAPFSAVKYYKIPVIEKHFTILPDVDTPDRPHSLTPLDFLRMVDKITYRQTILSPTIHDRDMYSKHKRRLVSTKFLKNGDKLSYGKNYGFYRVKDAVEGSFLDPVWPSQSIQGKVINKDIPPFTSISWDDFL